MTLDMPESSIAARAAQRRLDLTDFVRESNRIEGITSDPTSMEITAHDELLKLGEIRIGDLQEFVGVIAPGKHLRANRGMDVWVGSHIPPAGGPHIRAALDSLLIAIHNGEHDPFEAHQEYEHLHPFMDGNGRSGRAVWAWHMLRDGRDPFALSFLHRWYYDSLDHDPARGSA